MQLLEKLHKEIGFKPLISPSLTPIRCGLFIIFMKKIGVYSIKSPSGKFYVGSSCDIVRRWYRYRKCECKSQTKLYRSFLKHGVNNHKFKIEIECEFDELYEWEHHYSNYYNSIKDGLNCQIPGFKDVKGLFSDITKKAISEGNKGNTKWLGKKHTQESKDKMRAARLGKKLSDAHKKAIGIGSKKALSNPDVRAKISLASKTNNAKPDVRAKIGLASKTRWQNNEYKIKHAKAMSDFRDKNKV